MNRSALGKVFFEVATRVLPASVGMKSFDDRNLELGFVGNTIVTEIVDPSA